MELSKLTSQLVEIVNSVGILPANQTVAAKEINMIRIKNRLDEIIYQSQRTTPSAASRHHRDDVKVRGSAKLQQIARQLANPSDDPNWHRLNQLAECATTSYNRAESGQMPDEMSFNRTEEVSSSSSGFDFNDREEQELPSQERDSIEEMLSQLTMTPYIGSLVSQPDELQEKRRSSLATINN